MQVPSTIPQNSAIFSAKRPSSPEYWRNNVHSGRDHGGNQGSESDAEG